MIPRYTRSVAIRILGLDPGSRNTGFGIIDCSNAVAPGAPSARGALKVVAHGTLRVTRDEQAERLLAIYDQLGEVIAEHRPQVLAIEKVFFAKNAGSALKLGQARGAAMLTARIHGLEIFEYAPTEVKRAVVGHGQADKLEVQKMVSLILGEQAFASHDASDALALAICHTRQAQGGTAISPWAQALRDAEKSRGKRSTRDWANLIAKGRRG